MPETPRNPEPPASSPGSPSPGSVAGVSRNSDEDRPADTARARRSPLAVAALLLALAVLPYFNALGAGFVYDDAGLVRQHSAVQDDFDAARAVRSLYWEARDDTRLWRPFVTLSFAVDDAIADDSAAWMHAVNVLAHALVTLLAWAFLRKLGATAPAAFAAAALFAVHPLHTEAVTWISGRAELFAALGVFGAALAALRRGAGALALCAFATFFAAASKESAGVLPFFIGALSVATARTAKPNFAAALASSAGLGVYVVLRWLAVGTLAGPIVGASENAMVGTHLFERLPTVLDAAGRYVALLAWPRDLTIDYGPPVLGLATGISAYALLGLVSASLLLALAVLRRRERIGVAAVFTLVLYGVASNLFVVIGTNFAERLFYLPSFGILWIVAEAGAAVARKHKTTRLAASVLLAVVVGAAATRTVVRNRDYVDDLTLSATALAVHPGSRKMLYNRARELARLGRHDEAVLAAREALAAGANPSWSPVVLANALIALGRVDEAEATLRAVVEARPLEIPARTRWIELLDDRGESARGDALAEAALALAGDTTPSPAALALWARAASSAQSRGDLKVAAARWQGFVAQRPEAAHAWTQLGLSLHGLGRAADARAALERAVELDAENAEARNALAWLLTDAGETARAVEVAARAVELHARTDYLDTYARALAANGECELATRTGRLAAAGGDPELVLRAADRERRCSGSAP